MSRLFFSGARRSRAWPRARRGFTLVELVVSISLASVVVAFAAMFITTPVKSYQAQARRAELVDAADSILRLIDRDVRAALPNSVRVAVNGPIVALETLNAVDAVRYRDAGATADPSQELNFAAPDSSFASLSQFDGVTKPFASATHYLSIYNVGAPGADAYSLTNVITPPGTTIAINAGATAGEDLITLAPAFKFAYRSPGRRVYLVSGPVTYLCDPGAKTLRRYTGYSIGANQNSRDSTAELLAAGATAIAIANNVTACQFDYNAGTSMRAGVLTLRVTLNKDGESIWLVRQVHVENTP